jgi:hypothetical protein
LRQEKAILPSRSSGLGVWSLETLIRRHLGSWVLDGGIQAAHVDLVKEIMKFIIGEGGNHRVVWSLPGGVEKCQVGKNGGLFVLRHFKITNNL